MGNRRQASERSAVGVRLRPALVLLLVGAAACATPVGVRRLDIDTAYRLQDASALTTRGASEPSKALLRRLGLMDRFTRDPSGVLAELHRGLAPTGDEDRLFALAELSFLEAERTRDADRFLASAVYAYALLFPGGDARTPFADSDPRLRQTYDLYNQGLASAFAVRAHGLSRREPAEIRLTPGTRVVPFGRVVVDLDPNELVWAGYTLERFESTTTLAVRGLRNRYRRPGVGASLAAGLSASQAEHVAGAERIGPRTKVPVTAVLTFENPRAGIAAGLLRARLEVYTADQGTTVEIDGASRPLEFDTTAALASQLEGNPFYATEIAAFLGRRAFAQLLPKDRAHDGLAMLWPYRRGKIPVVLVHGTLSSPTRWAELVNELEGDPRIRDRFQIWLFIYDSGNPIGYSAGRLRAGLTAAVHELDPDGTDSALRCMVVMGHSQGGLLTKLTAIESGDRFWRNLTDRPFESLDLEPETRALLQQSVFFTPLPFVHRVVFLSTPHHGALLATGRLGALASWLVTLPTGLTSQFIQAATATGDERFIASMRRPATAIDNMSPSNPGLRTLSSIPVDPSVPAHSIIAVQGDGPPEDGNDGVVAYRSAHIDEAVSELVVRSGHSVQGEPPAIEEVRRILLEHAESCPSP